MMFLYRNPNESNIIVNTQIQSLRSKTINIYRFMILVLWLYIKIKLTCLFCLFNITILKNKQKYKIFLSSQFMMPLLL